MAYAILEAVAPSAKTVVFQVQNLEGGVDILDEAVDHLWAKEVALSDSIGRKASLDRTIR